MHQRDFLEKLDHDRVRAAIEAAEKRTSGEIRVHIQPTTRGADIRHAAERTFERLGVTRTEFRNGVLLFVACEEQRFVILGDSGINERVPAGFWDEIAAKLTIRFRKGEFTDGIVDAIHSAGEELAAFFPPRGEQVNELSNDISIEHH
ncbi:MAG TPA: TPM domain-containing protein [Thermoanaerobaculia bacterium]|nr:TPM domain-containing protein [Thermoanaerobaculia bacterium]